MRFQSLLFLGVVAANCATTQAAPVRKIVPKGATNFTSKAQHFSVWLPTKVFQSKKVVPLAQGKQFTVFIFQANANPVFYALIVSPKPPQVDITEPVGPLDAMQRGALRSSDGHLQKLEAIQLEEFPGREIKASSLAGAGTTRARFYLTPKNSYQIIAGGQKEEVQKQAAQIDKVFDSFRILPQK